MRFRRFVIVMGAALCAIAAASVVLADPVETEAKRAQDRVQSAGDQAAAGDERADVDRLSDLIVKWDDLRAAKASQKDIDAAKQEIDAELNRDFGESAAKEQTRNQGEEVSEAAHARNAERQIAQEQHREQEKIQMEQGRLTREQKRAGELLGQKQAMAEEMRGVQRQLSAGGDRAALEKRQAKLMHKYMKLSREEMKLKQRERHQEARDTSEKGRQEQREVREEGRQESREPRQGRR